MVKTHKAYEALLEISFDAMEAPWSKEDRKLRDWLAVCEVEDFNSVLGILEPRINNDVCTDRWFREVGDRLQDGLTDLDRHVGATLVVHELREYAGRTGFRPKPSYEVVLTRVHKRLGKHYKTAVPEVAPVRLREEAIASMLVQDALNSLTQEDVADALAGLDLDASLKSEKAKQILLQTVVSGGLPLLVKLLGKRVIKKVVFAVLEKSLAKKMGTEATKQILKTLAKKVPQKMLKKAIFVIAILSTVKDVWDLAGEATRVTTPMVVAISVGRTVSRLQSAGAGTESGKE